MATLIFDVDTQNDYLTEDGKLFFPNSEDIVENINKCLIHALRNEIVVSGTVTHRPAILANALIPCVFGTSGADKINETILVEPTSFYNVPMTRHGIDLTVAEACWQIYFEKESASIWSHVSGQPDNLMSFLRFEDITDVVVLGVNDIGDSVYFAIAGFVESKYNVRVVTDAVVNLDDRILDMESVEFITTEEFITK